MGEVKQISVDIDKECPVCGEPGSVNGGFCLECASIKMGETNYPISKAVEKAVELFAGNLARYRRLIYDAMMGDEDHEITLTCPVKIAEKGNGIRVEVGIGFAMGKVKDVNRGFLDEKQLKLF